MPNYKIPTIPQCYEIFKQCRTPAHIVRHCEVAAELAVEIAKKHSAKGTNVDVDFVHRACLLHDILRLNGKGHEEDAYQFLKKDYPELAAAIRKHAYKSLLDDELRPGTIEEKIVYYADKRVMHDKVVPLRQRLQDGHRRNSPDGCKKTTEYIDALIAELEKELDAV